ncbi:MAG: amino acid ABC transporter permease [Hyphomicrobiales bacterium]|nr:amino acid ABC transporter permease [Hyphomicrobiales bacterium]
MAVQDAGHIEDQAKVAFFNDPKVRSWIYQLLLVAFLSWLIWSIWSNIAANLEAQSIATGWGFLSTTAGFSIIQKLVFYSESSSYGRALWIGLLNTLLIAFLGVIFATILGFLIGIARLSSNWIVSKIATVYIEVIRNIPLLLQIFFWYFAALRALPGKRDKISLFDTIHLNITGLKMPSPVFGDGSWIVGIAFLLSLAAIFYLRNWARKKQQEEGVQFPVFKASLGILILVPLVAFFIAGMPIGLEHPQFVTTGAVLRRGFTLGVGMNLTPEFIALFLALVIYTAAFIAEIVRAGIMAVDKGQSEAAHALGLSNGFTLRLVVVPQAMRVIIPPLISQYLNLTKNSSLAVAIAYPDLVAVGGTVLNQTGQAIEIVTLWMVIYLAISLVISVIMNWYNQSIALVGR